MLPSSSAAPHQPTNQQANQQQLAHRDGVGHAHEVALANDGHILMGGVARQWCVTQ